MTDPTPRAYVPPQAPRRAITGTPQQPPIYQPVSAHTPSRPPLRRHVHWGGGGCIRGTVTTLHGTHMRSGIPTHADVRLLDERTSVLVAATWSDPQTGAYAFDHLADGIYTVIAYDRHGTHRAVIADRVRPSPMGDA